MNGEEVFVLEVINPLFQAKGIILHHINVLFGNFKRSPEITEQITKEQISLLQLLNTVFNWGLLRKIAKEGKIYCNAIRKISAVA